MTSRSRAIDGDELSTQKAVEGDQLSSQKAGEDDVEGHSIGVMNPILARELSKARERDIQREASRNSLIGDAKRALGRKR
jgi:hypothetical protein